MKKEVGEVIGSTIGHVLDVRSDPKGGAVGRCIRIRALVDINRPLVRWTSTNIGGTLCHIFFRYEKLANYCFYCDRLDHVDRECKAMILDGKKHFSPWLRANGQNSISLKEIAMDLERINPKPQPLLLISPRELWLPTGSLQFP